MGLEGYFGVVECGGSRDEVVVGGVGIIWIGIVSGRFYEVGYCGFDGVKGVNCVDVDDGFEGVGGEFGDGGDEVVCCVGDDIVDVVEFFYVVVGGGFEGVVLWLC